VFSLTAKGVYGLTAVFELGASYNQGPVQIKEIAKKHDIPQHYLEQLLVTLKKTGLVESFRGTQGGYALASSPEKIRMTDVLSALEGPLSVVPDNKKSGVLSFYWDRLEKEIGQILDMSLEQLIQEKQSMDNVFIYHI